MKYVWVIFFIFCWVCYANSQDIHSYVANSTVNIRECSSVNCKVIGTIERGKIITGELRPSGWIKVSVKNNNSQEETGYISQKFLTLEENQKSETKKLTKETSSDNDVMFYIGIILGFIGCFFVIAILLADKVPQEVLNKNLEEAKQNWDKTLEQTQKELEDRKLKEIERKAKPSTLYFKGGSYAEGKMYRGLKYGIWKKYRKDGSLEYELMYKADKAHGITKGYDKNGNLISESSFENGTLSGISKTYYKHGTIAVEAVYIDGKLNGIAKEYDKIGRLEREKTYKDDQVTNIKVYYGNGKLETEVSYKDDLLDGDMISYDKDGNISCITHYEDGILKSTEDFTKSGKPQTKINYKNGVWDGEVVTHDENGNVSSIGYFENGVLKSAESVENSTSDIEDTLEEGQSSSEKVKTDSVTKQKKSKKIKRRLEL